MAELTEAQRAQLEALRRSYLAELPQKLGLIVETAAALQASGREPALRSLHHLLHNLTGSAAVYGFDSISEAARDVEAWTVSAMEGGSAESIARLAALVDALKVVVHRDASA
jgi:chemotaxis protein histidine kinase CheA